MITTTAFSWADDRVKGMEKNLVTLINASIKTENTIYPDKETDVYEWESGLMQGIQGGVYVPEGQDPPQRIPREDYKISRAVVQRGIGLAVTEKMLEKRPSVRTTITEVMANSRTKTLEDGRQAHYDYSLDGATVPTDNNVPDLDVRAYDGLSYFNDSHTFLNSGVTNSNIAPTADRTLSVQDMSLMAQQARGWVDWDGKPMQPTHKRWIVGDNGIGLMDQLLKTDRDPFTNNNAINRLKHENAGKETGGSNYTHWNRMGTTEFMLELVPEVQAGEMHGLCTKFRKGKKDVKKSYFITGSNEAKVFEWRYEALIYGNWPYCHVTNRASL